jgi:hypothetical protein
MRHLVSVGRRSYVRHLRFNRRHRGKTHSKKV